MKALFLMLVMLCSVSLFACSSSNRKQADKMNFENSDSMKLKITIGTSVFNASLYSSETATAFKGKLPLTIKMNELNRNEKYYDLPNSLPSNSSNLGTIKAGDLMLYGSGTLVLFYKSFSTSYSYTKIGRIDNPSGLASALGSGNVTVTFEAE